MFKTGCHIFFLREIINQFTYFVLLFFVFFVFCFLFLQQSVFDVWWQLLENCKLSQVLGIVTK